MKHLKNFTESLFWCQDSVNDLREAYLSLCEILDDVMDSYVTVRIQTKNYTWGLLKRNACENFIEFCKGLVETTLFLQFEFNRSEIEEYRKVHGGQFPDWLIGDLQRAQNYLEIEGWHTKVEILIPNNLTQGTFTTVSCEISEINDKYKDAYVIFLIFSKLPKPQRVKKNVWW